MGCDKVYSLALWHAGAADQEGHVDVFFNSASLSWLKTMLSNVETIVRREDDIGIVEDAGLVETLDDGVDHLINGLQCLETAAIVVVAVCYLSGVQLGMMRPQLAMLGYKSKVA